MDGGMVAGALGDEQKTWRRNCLGKWYALGVATPVQQRAAVIELRTRSEADSREGRRGKTWDEIADKVGGPTSRTCPVDLVDTTSPSSSLCMSFMIDEPSHR